MVEVVGTMDEIEDEFRRLFAARREDIRDGRLDGRNWLIALAEEASEILRRRRTAEGRRSSGSSDPYLSM